MRSAEVIKEIAKREGISMGELAKRVGISRQALYKRLEGDMKSSNFSFATIPEEASPYLEVTAC